MPDGGRTPLGGAHVSGSGNPFATFMLRNRVAVYGGFAGHETSLDQRDHRANVTILSGDLAGDDDPNDPFNPGLTDDNAYSVVDGSFTDASPVLDGFTIAAANGFFGGGMYIDGGSPTMRNCVFQRNSALTAGGGMYIAYSSSPTIINCAFIGNVTQDLLGGGGGLMADDGSSPRLVNCLFKENEGFFGAGIRVLNADLDIISCTLALNEASAKGGGIEVSGSSFAMLRNSILWDNDAPDEANGDQMANASGTATTIRARFCDVEGDQAAVDRSGGGTIDWGAAPVSGNLDAEPVFAGPTDFHLSSASPCKDAGTNGAMPTYIVTDLDGNARILNGVINLGAYEGFDCNANGREDATDIAVGSSNDSPANGIPDECEVPLLWAVSRTANPNPAVGGFCSTQAVLPGNCLSEPHQSGIREMRFSFSGPPAASSLVSIDQATCAVPAFVRYIGAAVRNCTLGPGPNDLTCTFNPVLENARSYRFNFRGGSVKFRGLIGDASDDGFVNATDRSLVVGYWTGGPPRFSCETDINSDGATNATDRSIVVGYWTGLQNCAPSPECGEGLMGGEGGGESMMAGAASGEAQTAPPILPEGSWTYEASEIVVEVRPCGGGAPVALLEPNTRYEVYYAGAGHSAQGYSLFVCDPEDSGGIAFASPASQGTWSETGLFEFVDDHVNPEADTLECARSDLVMDDLTPDASQDGDQAYICDITTGTPGQLLLAFAAYATDEPAHITYQMNAQLILSVGSLPGNP